MKWVIYYSIAFILNTVCAITFHEYLNLVPMSVAPLFLMALSFYQAVYFYRHRSKKDFNTNNETVLTEQEWARLSLYMSGSYRVCIPLFVPFVLFFPSWAKLLSVLLFFAALTGGTVVYRIRHGKELQARLYKENDELVEQKKRESLGKWK